MITIAWDVDDVLNDLMRSWFEMYWLPEHPGCALTYEEIKENPPHKILGVSKDEYLSSLDEFRLSPLFQEMKPIAEIKDWFIRHGSKYRHIALTTTPLHAASASAKWVLDHFGLWIRTFHFVPSYRLARDVVVYDESKADYLKWFGNASVLVDDSEANVGDAEEIGLKGILLPRPWNRNRGLTIEESLEQLTEILSHELSLSPSL